MTREKLTPRPGWNRHLVNSAALRRGQHVVKCVLNPQIGRVKSPLSPAMPRKSGGHEPSHHSV